MKLGTSAKWTIIIYGLMLVLTIAAFILVCNFGESLVAPSANGQEPVNAITGGGAVLLRLLAALTAIVVLGQILSRLFAYLGQPPVVGEIAAGILLGPSLLGTQLSAMILPPSVAPFLGIIAQLGIILYMFLIGLELNPALLKKRSHTTIFTSHASILFPFILGAVLSLYLSPRFSDNSVTFTSFALFMGVAMSITAFPVLARILTDYRMAGTVLGVMALTCAAVDDVTAWCLLALVVGVAKANVADGLFVVIGAFAYISFMLFIGRPLLVRMIRRWDGESNAHTLVTLMFVALLLSALTSEAIGIHAIFGAFILGAVIPHDSAATQILTNELERLVTILFLPAFFALTGMRTRIDLLSDPSNWLICALVIFVAILGKFGGTFLAARITGLRWRNAAILGALMNTRGLMELIVLNVGLDLKIISPTIFSMMVLMALVTTALTSPILRLLNAPTNPDEE